MFISQSAIKMAPPFSLVSKFFISACFYLAIFALILPFCIEGIDLPLLSLSYASLVHLYLIGFVMMLIVGALYQLVPVVLEVSFSTLKFANTLFLTLFIGTLSFTMGFFIVNSLLIYVGAGLIYIALLYFSITFLFSFRGLEKWNFVRFVLFCSGVCLLLGLSFGLLALLALFGSVELADISLWIQRHVVFVFGGFVFLVILGVSMVLLPMFSLSHNFKDIYAKISFGFLLASLFASFTIWDFTLYFLFFAAFFYIVESIHILTLRVRKQRDYWFYNISIGLFYLFISAFISFLDIKVALFLVSFGFLYHFIVGHLYKILPFLVWYRYVSPHVGKKKIPMLNEMIDEKIAYLQLILSFFGVFAFGIGVISSYMYVCLFGAILFSMASFLVLYNVYFAYKFKNF